ncbi:hypothetical protein C8F04DRAFT_1264290 [Mycena alexandri]|uniref:CxC2-like cysteine cluster KDZ transposase-associated domain-containing protein n=1 Tax=Mycena alexandri TaxID=1745969 RepID=A0AAD6WYH2_9AGAR|nr:hypothetical protein C8F04DRAFT_1264290 [Mycena alexandri]
MARKRAHAEIGDSAHVRTHVHSFSVAEITGNNTNAPITTFIDRASSDNRRTYRNEIHVEPPSPVKQARAGQLHQTQADLPLPQPETDFASINLDRYEIDLDGHDNASPTRSSTPDLPTFAKPSDPALQRFRDLRDIYGAKILRRHGTIRAADPDCCRKCKKVTDPEESLIYRCKQCYGDHMLCGPCMVARHELNPLHKIERWNGRFFEKSSLKSLGLRVQLGHPPGERCCGSVPIHADFVVIHTNGIHEVIVDACDCADNRLDAGPPEVQMLLAGWFPATDDKPRTCATLECLDHFRLTTHQAKTTMYDYYATLEKLTDNTGVKPPYRYHAFIRMCREYGHLLMLIQAGRLHCQLGVAGTKPGECAVLCPCCPRPGVNLPDGWEQAPPAYQFLYILFLALDACFRLKRRLVSSERKDPALGPGWSYLVESGPYREYLLTVTDQKEMSTCSGLAALDHANTKFSRGYAATGVGMGVCARHEFVQPNGVGDLQKGERYANMDWIFASILRHAHPRLRKIVSYDILPPLLQLHLAMELMRFVIPKMHIHSHTLICQLLFSLNLVPGSAQTDGEGIERPWANIGGVASSTREMGPGSREDTLNSHWGFWNWQKLLGLGERLRTRADRAREEYAAQLEALTEFSVQQEDRVPVWLAMVQKYEANPDAPNPYATSAKGITEGDILLALEKDEEEKTKSGQVPTIHSVSPSSFVAAGLEVEDQQRRLRVQVELKKAETTAQQIDLVGLRRKLNQSIQRLRTLQATYTPGAIVALGARENVPNNEQPEQLPLFLPSALSTAQRNVEPLKRLAWIEDQLRDGQCTTALVRLRNQLHMKSRLLTYKRIQSRNQGANTRSRTIVSRNESKIRLHSEKYQMAWAAKCQLANGDRSKVGFQVLRKEDIRCMEDAEELLRDAGKRRAQEERRRQREDTLRATRELPSLTAEEEGERAARGGENVREVSWIWTAAGTSGTDAELEEALRIEWCKAYARTRRWGEEVQLVAEEVRRLGVTLEYNAQEWEDRAREVRVGAIIYEDAQAQIAFALKQAAMYRRIAARAVISMTEERMGRGKKRRMPVDIWRAEEGEEGEMGRAEEEKELDDLRANVSDEEFLLGGGEDDD